MEASGFIKLVQIVMVIMVLIMIGGAAFNYKLANDCIETNDPSSKECFKLNVYRDSTRTIIMN